MKYPLEQLERKRIESRIKVERSVVDKTKDISSNELGRQRIGLESVHREERKLSEFSLPGLFYP